MTALAAQGGGCEALAKEFAEAAAADREAAIAEFLPKFEAGASQNEGKPAALPYLVWIVRHDRVGKPVQSALATLANDHAGDPEIGELLDMLPAVATYLKEGPCDSLLDEVLANNGHPDVQARALIARAVIATTHVGGDYVDEAKADLENAKKLTKDPALLAAIDRIRLVERGLANGDVAPEVVGFDFDGVPFRLSDYRGKVVVLDFWGDW